MPTASDAVGIYCVNLVSFLCCRVVFVEKKFLWVGVAHGCFPVVATYAVVVVCERVDRVVKFNDVFAGSLHYFIIMQKER